MSSDQLKLEINKVLEHFSNHGLEEILTLLKKLDQTAKPETSNNLEKILSEDHNLLARLAK